MQIRDYNSLFLKKRHMYASSYILIFKTSVWPKGIMSTYRDMYTKNIYHMDNYRSHISGKEA